MLKKVHFILILSILFIGIFSINTYAVENIPLDTFKHASTSFSARDYILFDKGDGYKSAFVLYYDGNDFNVTDHISIVKDSSPVKIKVKRPSNVEHYYYCYWTYNAETDKWSSVSFLGVGASSPESTTTTVDGSFESATFTVNYSDGTPFFQVAPVEGTILEKIMEMVPEMANKIMATVKILVPFGVGLLALLIGLHLLPKVLYRFL